MYRASLLLVLLVVVAAASACGRGAQNPQDTSGQNGTVVYGPTKSQGASTRPMPDQKTAPEQSTGAETTP
jgi:hypothetical protein